MAKLISRSGAALSLLVSFVVAPSSAADFPSAHEMPPAWWPAGQPTFVLSADYPVSPPSAETYPWKRFDFRTQGFDYLKAVLAYAYEGNLTAGRYGWQIHLNTTRTWYHAPWMDVGKNGREFVRGLTRERTSPEGELWSDPPSPPVQNWAVGFYNAPGGYVIGQVWKDPKSPDPTKGRSFPDGTVGAKLLFTAASPKDVPYLRGAPEWQVNIHRSLECRLSGVDDKSPLCERQIQTVRLLQIDIAVRDDRPDNPSPSGWVFGTFVYNAAAPGRTPWERVVPVGVMWGNDPGVTPDMVAAGYPLRESVINHSRPPQHLGCAGRLNGPVDNPVSSCMSCHGLAQYPPPRSMVPRACDSSQQSLDFFQNLTAASPREPGVIWMDYSLQLSVGFNNFCQDNPNYAHCKVPTPPSPASPGAPTASQPPAPSLSREAPLPRPSRGD